MTKPFAGKETIWRWEPRWEQENEETLKVSTFIDILFCIDIVGKNHKTKYVKDILCSNTQHLVLPKFDFMIIFMKI